MNWMLDLWRSHPRPTRSLASQAGGRRHRQSQERPRVESLEGRSLLSLGSIFSGLIPTFNSGTAVKGDHALLKYLSQPESVSFPPYSIILGVQSSTGSGQTPVVSTSKIKIVGQAPPKSTIWIAYGPLGYFNNVTYSDAKGNFSFNGTVPRGTTLIRAFSGSLVHTYTDRNGTQNYVNDYSNIAEVRVINANPVVTWDAIALEAIRNANITAEVASRDLAILHIAQYDAITATTNSNATFLVHPASSPGASPEAAANSAAAAVLTNLFPAQASAFATALMSARAGLPDTVAVRNGFALGQAVGDQVLVARANDHSTLVTAGGVIPNPAWGQVTPFAIASAAQFRPAAPPASGSAVFDQALAEVTQLGRSTSTARTADQTVAAQFWNDGAGSATNPGHWNAIAQEFAVSRNTNLLATARTFAMLDVALADAAIASFDAKATFNTARPVATIQTSDSTWTPLLQAYPTPSYVSAHAAYGAAASEILGSIYGRSTRFTTQTNATADNPSRTFANFAAAATEDANSRIYGGVNFRFDTTAGSKVGDAVGKAVLTRFPK